MYAKLGNIVFERLIGFETLTKDTETTYAELALIDGKTRLQRTGEQLISQDFTVHYHRAFCIPEDRIKELELARSNGEVLPLFLGTGEFIANFVITTIKQTFKLTDPTGLLIECSVAVNIKEYVEPDPLRAQKNADKNNGFASNSDKVVPVKSVNTIPSPANQTMKQVNAANQASKSATDSVSKLKDNQSSAQKAFSVAKKALKAINAAHQAIHALLNKYNRLAQTATNLHSAVTQAQAASANLSQKIANGDIQGAISASDNLVGSTNNMNIAATPLAGLKGRRGVYL